MKTELREKYERLLESIRLCERAAVAFSGGVDSAFLAWAAAGALGRENVICITARAASFPERELREAEAFCRENGIRQEIFDFNDLGVPGFSENPPDRCYHCKKALFSEMIRLSGEAGFPVILEGSNFDDERDYRPGLKAVAELGAGSPLREAGLSKEEIRELSKTFGLPTWEKPSFACLASRFAYGETITREKLEMVGRAEQFLLDRGFRRVRVRIHGTDSCIARIEPDPEDIHRLAADPLRSDTITYFKGLGFKYVSLDLEGYRTGSMNEGLNM